LEILEKVNVIVVDKTGTLTEGKPTVQKVIALPQVRTGSSSDLGLSEDEVLRLAASLERHSEHPLASAIVKEAENKGIALKDVGGFESRTAMGVFGIIDGHKIAIGNERILERDEGSPIAAAPGSDLDGLRSSGQTTVFMTIDDELAGIIGIADAVKPSAERAIDELHRRNIQVVMMTGDNRATADAVAKQLGIDQIFAEVMPEDKAAKVIELQSQGRIVAMAGDGVNDAPALAQADVGIAFASGTDVAIEAGDITLLRPDLNGILKALNLSRGTMKNIRQNLFFAFAYNVIGVPIAAGVLFPFIGLLLSPMIASAAMTFSSVSVIGNALRLRRIEL